LGPWPSDAELGGRRSRDGREASIGFTGQAQPQNAGVPLYVSPAVTAGTIWGIPKPRVLIAIRQDVDLRIDESAYFANDQTGIRAVLRVAFAFPHEAAIQRIMLGEDGS